MIEKGDPVRGGNTSAVMAVVFVVGGVFMS